MHYRPNALVLSHMIMEQRHTFNYHRADNPQDMHWFQCGVCGKMFTLHYYLDPHLGQHLEYQHKLEEHKEAEEEQQ